MSAPDTESGAMQIKTDYRRYIFRKIAFITACVVVVVILSVLSCAAGDREIPFWHVFEIIWNNINGITYEIGTNAWWDDYIVCSIRLPRIVIGIIAGASLALGGITMQSLLKNPLADPYITGISSGACFGAVAAIVMGMTFSAIASDAGIMANAFIGSLVPALMIILISRRVRSSPATMVLAGTAISYFFNALTTLIMVSADENKLATAYRWQIGTLENAVWDQIPLMLVITVAGMVLLLLVSSRLNVLSLGDDNATSLGLNVTRFRTFSLILLSVMTAAIISYTGIIGFVGLIAPHMVRMIIGSDNRYLIPASMAFGAALIVGTDIIARIIVSGGIPVGVILSFLGGPMLLYLILRQKKSYGEVQS